MRCPQMGYSCGSPRPICPVLATTLALLPMPWGKRPNTHSSASFVSTGPPLVNQVLQQGPPSFRNHCHPFCHSKCDRKNNKKSNQAPDVHSNSQLGPGFCTGAFPVIVHAQTVTAPPAGTGKGSLGQKVPFLLSRTRKVLVG